MIIAIHGLQALGPNAFNRDENGHPKRLQLGDMVRGRISSQAQKRSMRKWAEKELPDGVGIRTTRLRDRLFLPRLRQLDSLKQYNDEALNTIAGLVVTAFAGRPAENGRLASAVFTWPGEIDLLAQLSAQRAEALLSEDRAHRTETADQIANEVATANLKKPFSIAAFGRMIAALPAGQIDGAIAFSHAYTTHNIFLNVDNFTAIDDLTEPGEASAFFLSDAPFIAPSVYYRHFTVNTTQLEEQLGSLSSTLQAVRLILEAFWHAVPSGGRQRAYKADDKPQFVLVTVNGNGSSMGSAFMAPVQDERDVLGASIRQFDDAWRRSEVMRRRSDDEKIFTVSAYPEILTYLADTIVAGGYDELIDQVVAQVGEPIDAVPAA